MVLSRYVEDEIDQVESIGRDEFDYEKRLGEILATFNTYPAGDKPIEKKLRQYRKELKEEDPSREEYVDRLNAILSGCEFKR